MRKNVIITARNWLVTLVLSLLTFVILWEIVPDYEYDTYTWIMNRSGFPPLWPFKEPVVYNHHTIVAMAIVGTTLIFFFGLVYTILSAFSRSQYFSFGQRLHMATLAIAVILMLPANPHIYGPLTPSTIDIGGSEMEIANTSLILALYEINDTPIPFFALVVLGLGLLLFVFNVFAAISNLGNSNQKTESEAT